MTCEDAIALLGDYLEASLTPEGIRRLEAHLKDCPACRAYLNTYRRTREVTAQLGPAEMPADMKTRLRAFLRKQIQASPRWGG
jgi:predicted anti-sigma-YlaC factor YlaD